MRENLAGPRIELGDVIRALLDLLDTDAHPARDLGKTPFPEVRHVVLDNFVFETVAFSFALELDQQALPQIARTDSRRVEALNEQQHRLEVFLGDAGIERHLFRGGLEKTVIVDIANDE